MVARVVPKSEGRLISGAWTSNQAAKVLARDDQPVDARAVGEEGVQRLQAGQHHRPTSLFDQRGVADEVQGIAQALLGYREDGPPSRGEPSHCGWLNTVAEGAEARPYRHSLGPALFELAQQQPGQ